MINKKTNKDYCRAYRQKKRDMYKANNAMRNTKMKEKDMFKKKFPFWQKRDIGVFTYIWTTQSLT